MRRSPFQVLFVMADLGPGDVPSTLDQVVLCTIRVRSAARRLGDACAGS